MHEQQQRLWARMVAQAWADADYKARLLADSTAVLREAGVEVPAGVEVRVVENSETVTHLVLPSPPPETQLEQAEERTSADWLCWPFCCEGW